MGTIFVTVERATGGYIVREVRPYNPPPEGAGEAPRKVHVVSTDKWNPGNDIGKIIVDALKTEEERAEDLRREQEMEERMLAASEKARTETAAAGTGEEPI